MTAVLITGALTGDLVGRCAPRRRPHEANAKRYALMIVALLTFGIFGVMSGILSVTQVAEAQPAQSEPPLLALWLRALAGEPHLLSPVDGPHSGF